MRFPAPGAPRHRRPADLAFADVDPDDSGTGARVRDCPAGGGGMPGRMTHGSQPQTLPRRFTFAFDRRFKPFLAVLGILPQTASVTVDAENLTVGFGPWRLHTPRDNVVEARRTGPYRWWRVIGLHLSLTDRGLSFGTGTGGGVCVRFGTPVTGVIGRWLNHPAVTVTVEDPDALIDALGGPEPGRPPEG
jgi:hypothetical protein